MKRVGPDSAKDDQGARSATALFLLPSRLLTVRRRAARPVHTTGSRASRAVDAPGDVVEDELGHRLLRRPLDARLAVLVSG